jgi:hypothetical protein
MKGALPGGMKGKGRARSMKASKLAEILEVCIPPFQGVESNIPLWEISGRI